MERDPVCGMDVDSQNAPARGEYHGKTYHFCSEACKKKFDANPEQYAKQQQRA